MTPMLRVSSPRLRRRIKWSSIVLAPVVVVVLVFVFLPEPKQPSTAATGKPGSAQVLKPVNRHVPRRDRLAIDETLDRFIPAAIGQRSMTTAWRLAGPELKAASTLGQWRRNVSPIPYYPVAGKTFDDWQTIDAGRNYVDFSLSVRPRPGSHLGSWTLKGEMVRRGSRWLVNRIYVSGTYSEAGAPTGPALDVGPGGGGKTAPPGHAALGFGWLVGLIASIGTLLLLAPALLFALFLRNRVRRRRNPPRPLPPLPARVVPGSGDARERLYETK